MMHDLNYKAIIRPFLSPDQSSGRRSGSAAAPGSCIRVFLLLMAGFTLPCRDMRLVTAHGRHDAVLEYSLKLQIIGH